MTGFFLVLSALVTTNGTTTAAKTNRDAIVEAARLSAEATKSAAKMNADALCEVARITLHATQSNAPAVPPVATRLGGSSERRHFIPRRIRQ